jgi:rsbT co-antagonist protein RsbR
MQLEYNTMPTEELIEHFSITESDLQRIKQYGEVLLPKIETMMDLFYEWMETLPEYNFFFQSKEKLQYARRMQTQYWHVFYQGRIDEDYVNMRRRVGEVHANIGLSLSTNALGMNRSFCIMTDTLYENEFPLEEYTKMIQAITKLLNFDLTITVESYNHFTSKIIADQSQALDMSTPLIQIWENIIMVPIVGIIDSKRSNELMNGILTKISETQAKVIILDISGVAIVDTAVANHLIKISKATTLMGAKCIFSGLSPSIAETIVELGIDVGSLQTTGTLKDALLTGYETLNLKIVNADEK